jgi:hypothetical protein
MWMTPNTPAQGVDRRRGFEKSCGGIEHLRQLFFVLQHWDPRGRYLQHFETGRHFPCPRLNHRNGGTSTMQLILVRATCRPCLHLGGADGIEQQRRCGRGGAHAGPGTLAQTGVPRPSFPCIPSSHSGFLLQGDADVGETIASLPSLSKLKARRHACPSSRRFGISTR